MLLCALPLAVQGQQCDFSKRPGSSPDSDFVVHADGTVTHLESGLTWMRCGVGQIWHDGQCANRMHKLSWPQAQQEINFLQQNSKSSAQPWRMPTIAELALLVERQCKNPRINLRVFPNTPPASFWTSSHRKGHVLEFYVMDFGELGVLQATEQEKMYLRLVKGR